MFILLGLIISLLLGHLFAVITGNSWKSDYVPNFKYPIIMLIFGMCGIGTAFLFELYIFFG